MDFISFLVFFARESRESSRLNCSGGASVGQGERIEIPLLFHLRLLAGGGVADE
jgi:hypothetical protein